MKRALIVVALAVVLIAGLVPGALAADLDTDWGTGGVASLPIPAGTSIADSALLPGGGVVVVGASAGRVPWGGVVDADGASLTAFSGFAMPDAIFDAVAVGNSRIYAVGDVGIGLGVSTFVAVFDLSGVHVTSHTFAIAEYTVPTSAVVDSSGRPFVAGTGRGDDDGSEQAWVVRLASSGMLDAGFPTLLLAPPFAGYTNPVAYVGATAGQTVAVVTGDDDPAPGSSIGFHRVTETGSVFMADFTSARTIVDADMDSSSGQAVFGSVTPGTTLTDLSALVHSIGTGGATDVTALAVWVDAAGRIEAGRTRTDSLLGAGESDVNVFVDLVQTTGSFATRSEAELADLDTDPGDGAVFVTMRGPDSGDVVIAKYVGDDSGRFIDDDTSVHETDIERFAELGITLGCNPPVNDEYCPVDTVTRGQMAAFLNRALSLPASTTDHFIDDNGSTFEADINAIADAGITLGCNPPTNDRYCAGDTVTRGQMAAFLKRAFALPGTATDFFVDDNGSTFEADINAIADAGITLGCNPPTNDRYCPTQNVTRGQMASFVVRAVDV
ncbi:MAG: hypothetical protein GY788_22585 [bacterium]|nr:hypothetical protein [bacterium]